MDAITDRTDIDRLLSLIGMLGDPAHPGFWDSWRTNLHGYPFGKMKAGIQRAADLNATPYAAHSFAGYVLKFFSTDSAKQEDDLVEAIGGYISGHDENQLAIQFLADIRSTAWHLYRDYGSPSAETVASWWAQIKQ